MGGSEFFVLCSLSGKRGDDRPLLPLHCAPHIRLASSDLKRPHVVRREGFR